MIVQWRLFTGVVTVRLFPEVAPHAASMVMALVRGGYYTGLAWHTIDDRVAATGCPVGEGIGTVAWYLEPETSPDVRHVRGSVSLEPLGRLVSSRVVFLKRDVPEWDGERTVVGTVIDGMRAIDVLRPRRGGGPPRTLLATVVDTEEVLIKGARGGNAGDES